MNNNTKFSSRHIGLSAANIEHMLEFLGYDSLDALSEAVVPDSIKDNTPLALKPALTEEQALAELHNIAQQNHLNKSLIGQGYYGTHTPKVIQRNVLENPAWYTAYTPYQPEISQGRLEVLFYFQTMVTELTGLDIANASLLDEATAAAEAMTLAHRSLRGKRNRFLVSSNCHPQTIEIIQTRAKPLNIEIVEFDEHKTEKIDLEDVFAAIVQYPDTYGNCSNLSRLSEQLHQHGALAIFACDLLALTLLTPPSDLGADIAIGSAQRFGVPLGFGGPHAGFFAVKDKLKRSMPGRLVGQSVDAHGNPAYRLALQAREQHIRRDKATSNICTAQALLAIISTLYACYHGPVRLRRTALYINQLSNTFQQQLNAHGYHNTQTVFDTLTIETPDAASLIQNALQQGYNLNQRSANSVSLSFDETCTLEDVTTLLSCFIKDFNPEQQLTLAEPIEEQWQRPQNYLRQSVFHDYHSETQMMRYLRTLSEKDIALDRAMIPLGSCTMKLNAASEMTPISWPEFANMHPFTPAEQSKGYHILIEQLEQMLCACTGYAGGSLQPNAGSQGEYAGLLAIKAYHEANNDFGRNICLIPSSAHGTNPASSQMANMKVVGVACDAKGNIDIADLKQKVHDYPNSIAAIMVTYPSTHGVFETEISEVCRIVHDAGGQVYIDGANLNALVGLAQPGKFGGDVSHLNLHKTFCIPHGGGGPGVGPVMVAEHLTPFLPRDNVNTQRNGAAISATPFGSASILPISWMYIRMMGAQGLRRATQCAILSANYIAKKLQHNYPILYTGENDLVAHECIIDTRPMKEHGVSVDDIAKRLIDYGFHAPTMSFPVPGTLMIEPTESEPLSEIERFCRAMDAIFAEYTQIKHGEVDAHNNVLRNAPHTMQYVLASEFDVSYTRQQACLPDPMQDYSTKYWPPVARVDNVYGDKNLVCSCPSMDEYM